MVKILVVEDEPKLREIYTEVFEDEGYEITTAENGLQAVEKLNSLDDIDIMLTDIKMPDMNGLELIEKVREAGINIPIIIASAYENLKTDFTVVTSNITAFITKPVDIDELLNKVYELTGE